MDLAHMTLQSIRSDESLTTIRAVADIIPIVCIVDTTDMLVEIALFRESIVTNTALEAFHSQMHVIHMLGEVSLQTKSSITVGTAMGFLIWRRISVARRRR